MSAKPGLFLKKANDDLVSHCKCSPSVWIAGPGQLDCPWCGCGWLFICPQCRRAFTFAVAESCDLTWEELAWHDLKTRYSEPPTDEEVEMWIDCMKSVVGDLEEGKQYVYLDFYAIPVDAENFDFDGMFSQHKLLWVPQVQALTKPAIVDEVLSNPDYWLDRRIDIDDEYDVPG
ncbi:hypothetical protein AB1L30_22555 [Bremerella sp. JC817]|uniref:hypothetical protein n=1 Tax=Bremerella sp. JC817 TaxID=3231756 RepID=UPI003459E538